MGRGIGYVHSGICDHPGCYKKINRGLSYACGGMHGNCADQACEKYFCQEHLLVVENIEGFTDELSMGQLCRDCFDETSKLIGEYVMHGDYKLEIIL